MSDSGEIWTIKTALDWCRGYLERKGDKSPRLSAEWLLAKTTGLSRVELYVNYDRPLSFDERQVLHNYVARRGAGEPLQYITGEVAFRYITVKVHPGVLIPRPETEVLVSEALSLLPSPLRRRATDSIFTEDEELELLARLTADEANDSSDEEKGIPSEALENANADKTSAGLVTALDQGKASLLGQGQRVETRVASKATINDKSQEQSCVLYVADIGTGSGCIACSIAQEHPDTRVIATDISTDACALARENVETLGLQGRVHVTQGNLGEAVPERFIGVLDLVVSNPPYVPTSVMKDIPREVVQFEPSIALDGGADGLEVFRPLTQWAFRALKPGGGYAVELHETCLDAAADIACSAGFCEVRVVDDLAGKPRVLSARKPA